MFLPRKFSPIVAGVALLCALSAPAHADKAKAQPAVKSQVSAAADHWETMADIYHRALIQMHGELVELKHKCGLEIPRSAELRSDATRWE